MPPGNTSPLDALNNEVGISRHLHISHLNSPSVFEMDNGSVNYPALKDEACEF